MQVPALLAMRRSAALLILAALLPLSLFSVVVSLYAIGWQQTAAEQEAMAQVRLLMERTERVLESNLDRLRLLGHSTHLDGADPRLAPLHALAQRYVTENGTWTQVRLFSPDGHTLIDTAVPFGEAPTPVDAPELVRSVIETRAPVISGVLPHGPAPVSRQRVIVFHVPVLRDGQLRYVLSAAVSTTRLAELVDSVRQYEGWRPYLVDNAGRVVAMPAAPQAVGFLILPAGVAARDAAASGSYTSKTPSGEPTVTIFARSIRTGWSAHIAIPVSVFNGPVERFRMLLGFAAALTAALTGVFAYLLRRESEVQARRIAVQEHTQRLEALGRVTGGVAHDFNNLLTVILGNITLIRKGPRTGDRADALIDTALMAAERGATLTQRLLSISRKQELKPQSVGVKASFDAVIRMTQQSFSTDVVVRHTIAPGVSGVAVDPAQFEATLLNLCTNARDAMPAGGVITLSARAVNEPKSRDGLAAGDYVVIGVADTGCGMDAVTAKRALEPYYSTKGDKGTGLGLSSAQGFARQSGGELFLTSETGRGTTVELWLRPAMAAAPSVQAEERQHTGRLHVLVVDDEPLVALSTTSMLEDQGHTVTEAASGPAALDALSAGTFDAVVTDFRMPGMTGVELARAVKARWPGLPVLVYTGFADTSTDERAGFPFLLKPASARDLLRAIQGARVELAARSPGAAGAPSAT